MFPFLSFFLKYLAYLNVSSNFLKSSPSYFMARNYKILVMVVLPMLIFFTRAARMVNMREGFLVSLQYHTKAIKLTFKIQGLNLPLISCSSLNSTVLKSDYESRQIKTSFIDLGTFFYATQILCRLVAEIFDGNKFNKKSYIPL